MPVDDACNWFANTIYPKVLPLIESKKTHLFKMFKNFAASAD